MKNTKTASLEELRKMQKSGELHATREDAAEFDMPDDFWDVAEVLKPATKKAVSLRVDPDILEYFKDQGSGHLTKMHAVLRAYVDAQKKRRHTPS